MTETTTTTNKLPENIQTPTTTGGLVPIAAWQSDTLLPKGDESHIKEEIAKQLGTLKLPKQFKEEMAKQLGTLKLPKPSPLPYRRQRDKEEDDRQRDKEEDDIEVKALIKIVTIMEFLDEESQHRILNYLLDRFKKTQENK
jgi:hypothetical protein